MEKIIIRKAKSGDLPAIYSLVEELAAYANAAASVTATLADYKNDFEAGIFEAQVAESEEKIIGTAIYYMTYSTWKGRMLYLEDFVVRESHRQKGIGQLLFDRFLAEAVEKKARLVKWQVLEWNEPALSFYRKNEAIIEKNWWSAKIFLEK